MPNIVSDYFRYVPVRQRDVQWGLYVTGAGATSIPPGVEYPPPNHPELYNFRWKTGRTLPEYQAIYITAGRGVFESTAVGPVDIEPGSLILLFPGVWHRYRPQPEVGWDEHWVSFNGETMDRLTSRNFFASDRAIIAAGLRDDILKPFLSIHARLQGESPGFPHLIAADVMEILAAIAAVGQHDPVELISQGPRHVPVVKDRIVAEAMRLIWEQSQGPMTVDSLARQLPVTRRSLERSFRAAVGHGIYDEIVRCRLERAKRLLTRTDLPLKEVAAAAGFPSADNLGRLFRRLEKTTPLDYRKRNVEK